MQVLPDVPEHLSKVVTRVERKYPNQLTDRGNVISTLPSEAPVVYGADATPGSFPTVHVWGRKNKAGRLPMKAVDPLFRRQKASEAFPALPPGEASCPFGGLLSWREGSGEISQR